MLLLLLLAVVQAAVGGWIVVRPNTFYDNWFVALDMPYNEHLTLDLGAFNVAFGVLLGCASVSMERRLVQVTLASYMFTRSRTRRFTSPTPITSRNRS